MRYPSWNSFLNKYRDNPEDAFEALCRLLFHTKYGLRDSLPYFYNNAGNETVPIVVGNELIGFQSKFFTGNTINDKQAGQIKHSIDTAHKHYPKQTKIIVYTNLAFGNPKVGSQQTAIQKSIEDTAKADALSVEWVFGDNVLDLVSKTPLAYSLFFDSDSNLNHLPSSVESINKLCFGNINSTISYLDKDIELDRSKELTDLKGYILNGKNVLVYGDSGSGKSSIVKRFWQGLNTDKTIVFYFTRGAQYDTKSIDDLFLLDEAYTFRGFRDFYQGFTRKILIIDSAERLTEISNTAVFQLTLGGLYESGWQFILTCKSNAYDSLRSLLKDMGIIVEDLKVEILQEEMLRELASQHQMILPQSEKIIHQLQIPFYLARYCELGCIEAVTPDAFREAIWQQKVRGIVRGGIQQKREDCLLQIVYEQQARKAFFVAPNNIDHDVAYCLIQEDVLIEQPHRGYAVKHDLYVDWALEFIVDQECSSEIACVRLLETAPKSITYQNAFYRWLQNMIDSGDRRVDAIMDAFINGSIHKSWEHCLLAAVGESDVFATVFFAKYDVQLKANNYWWFDRFIDVLTVSCKAVSRYLEYKGDKIPIYHPVGRGWDEAVLFVYANRNDYYLNHLATVQKLLDGYSRMGNKAVAMDQASQLSLILFDKVAESRKNGVWTIFNNEKKWCELVCTYAFGIRKELQERFAQVITNRWVGHTAPYSELIDYILKDANYLSKSMLYLSCLDSVIALMHLFWREQPKDSKGNDRNYHSSFEREDVFGLNEVYGMAMAYYPSSPYQTPIYYMLEAEKLLNPEMGTKVLDFIINFMNDCVKFYDERDKYDERWVINVQFPDRKVHDIIASQSLWNLYRGTARYTIPHLLESIHMALEGWLLKLTDLKQKPDWLYIERLLWRILTQSNSASLYAIVSSIAIAHPDELFDILMFLCQDIRFLALDLHRCSAEISVQTQAIAFHRHQTWWEERNRSNSLPHRQQHLETMLLSCQYKYDIADNVSLAKKRDVAYHVVDELKKQVSQFGQEDSIYRFILARVDYRSYNKQKVSLSDGVEAVQLTPSFTTELEEERKKVFDFANRLGAINLRVWADKKFKGKENDLKGNPFVGNSKGALEAIKVIEKQITDHSGDQLLLPGDVYVPYMASAVLLMFERETLNEKEIEECWERVMLALNSLRGMLSSTLSELEICIASIPSLIEVYPLRQSDFIPIITSYVKITDEFINERVCDLLSDAIHRGRLWDKYPDMMNSALDQLQEESPNKDFGAMNSEMADAVLCLLTYEPIEGKRALGRACVEKLSYNWSASSPNRIRIDNHHLAERVAKYVLFAPKEEVTSLIRPYVSLLGWDSSEPLIGEFVIGAPLYNRYENFWLVWNTLYQPVIQSAGSNVDDSNLNEYLLNPLFMASDNDNWFKLEKKDLLFFDRVVNDIGGHPAVLYALCRVFATIGQKYSIQSVSLFNKIIVNNNPNVQGIKSHVVFYLEKIVKRVVLENEQEIRSDLALKNHLIAVLEFMRNNGSSVADGIIKNL